MFRDRQEPLSILRHTFGFSGFRGLQEEVITQVCSGGHALVVMPTGSGKSLCYQIPAIVRPGTGIIVSPLIALMQDQVAALRELGVSAAALNSAQSPEESRAVLLALQDGTLDLLYVAPERLLMESFLQNLKASRLALFAIDEAHCISAWGHDFRPEYHRLDIIAQLFPEVPRIALTATADAPTRDDIVERLSLQKGRHFLGGFDRPNIRYSVQPKTSGRRQLLNFVRAQGGEAGIIYCLSRARTEEIASWLSAQGIPALAYHSGMAAGLRAAHQERFLKEAGLVIVATIAFGMGIDKPDVRFVVHFDPPRSLEAYYQETGRAGRDSLPAETLLLFGLQDIAQHRRMIEDSQAPIARKGLEHRKLDALLGYSETLRCRRQVLLEYFGDDGCAPCGNCDICLFPPESFDGTVAAQKALSAVYRSGQRYGSAHIIDLLLGRMTDKVRAAGHQKLPTFGVGSEFSAGAWRSILRQLVSLGLLEIDLAGYGGLRLTEKSRPVLRSEAEVPLRHEVGARRKSIASGRAGAATAGFLGGPGEQELFEALREKRLELARKANVPPYIIFHDSTLVEMVKMRPRTLSELSLVPGVGDSKLARYGAAFLDVIGRAATCRVSGAETCA